MRCGPIARLSLPVSQHLLLDCFRRLWGHVIVAASAAPFLGPQLLRFCPDGLFHLFLGVGFVRWAVSLSRHCVFSITPNCCLGLGNALVPSASLMLLQSLPLGMPCLSPPGRSSLLPAPLHILPFSSVHASSCGVKTPTPASPLSSLLPFFPQEALPLFDRVSLRCPFCGSPLCSSNSILVFRVCLGLGLDVISL